ncbi:hypothetical protein HNQ50_000158 [Silvimonas terrae]|uniref:Uncharacterized protein n=1 Tax=Silvimonas terrae TaxID=300266 RepID=A0A840RA90_9NEIS|nr:hypothetical protein [Silvimonas terrae]MBB5189448.1 hypothetical protein [Silvimonas terrae]
MLSRKLALSLLLAVLAGSAIVSCRGPLSALSAQSTAARLDVTTLLQPETGLYHFVASTNALGQVSGITQVQSFLDPVRRRVVIPEQGMQAGLRMEDYAWPLLTSSQRVVVGAAQTLPVNQVYRLADGTTAFIDDVALGHAGNNLFGEALYHGALPDGFVFTPGMAAQPVKVQLVAHDVSGLPMATVLQHYVAQAGGLDRFALDRLVAASRASMPPGAVIYTERHTYGADQILFQPDPQARTLPDMGTLALHGGHLLEVAGWNDTHPRLLFDMNPAHPEDALWESLTGFQADGRVYRAEYDRAGRTVTRMPAFNRVAADALAAAIQRQWQDASPIVARPQSIQTPAR